MGVDYNHCEEYLLRRVDLTGTTANPEDDEASYNYDERLDITGSYKAHYKVAKKTYALFEGRIQARISDEMARRTQDNSLPSSKAPSKGAKAKKGKTAKSTKPKKVEPQESEEELQERI